MIICVLWLADYPLLFLAAVAGSSSSFWSQSLALSPSSTSFEQTGGSPIWSVTLPLAGQSTQGTNIITHIFFTIFGTLSVQNVFPLERDRRSSKEMAGLCVCVCPERSFLASTLWAPIYSSWRPSGDRANHTLNGTGTSRPAVYGPCQWQRPRSESLALTGRDHLGGSSFPSASGQKSHFSLLIQQSVAWPKPSVFLSELYLPARSALTVCGLSSWCEEVMHSYWLNCSLPVQGL